MGERNLKGKVTGGSFRNFQKKRREMKPGEKHREMMKEINKKLGLGNYIIKNGKRIDLD